MLNGGFDSFPRQVSTSTLIAPRLGATVWIRQAVRHGTLTPAFAGPIPASTASTFEPETCPPMFAGEV